MSVFSQASDSLFGSLMAFQGESVVYRTIAGVETEIQGIVEIRDSITTISVSDGRNEERTGTVQVWANDDKGVSAPAEGDSIVIRGETWKVVGSRNRSTTAILLDVELVVEIEKSAEGYRRSR